MSKIHIIVAVSPREDGRVNIEISSLKDEPRLDLEQTTHALASAISLLIKSAHQSDEIKDYKLMTNIIEHLNSDFVSNDSFSDLNYNKIS